MAQSSEAIKTTDQILRGGATTVPQLEGLIDSLQAENHLGYARQLLEKALVNFPQEPIGIRLKWLRKLAVCTYKDPDEPIDRRLRRAETMLNMVFEEKPAGDAQELAGLGLETLRDSLKGQGHDKQKQDLLGIAGAVQKRRWETYGTRRHLVAAYHYYKRGNAYGSGSDDGYTGINLAFVLDLLSEQDDDTGRQARHLEADAVRSGIVGVLTQKNIDPKDPNNWWMLCTLGEAYLGLGKYGDAVKWMHAAAALKKQMLEAGKPLPPWQFETTARQVAKLARMCDRLQRRAPSETSKETPQSVVKALLGDQHLAADSFLRGKVGLALSGGGFRASLFHIGVLARLAELDQLRHVEVLSCVSGGSIVGAYYYLELRQLLQEHKDESITREHYIQLVERMRKNFLDGVESNLCLRMLLGWRSNLRVLFSRKSSMCDRLAELYEGQLYSKVKDGHGSGPRYLADLNITPLGTTSFRPKYENWTRQNKIPILVLNATTLNTCHNWQFTASYMGEPPTRAIDAEINSNDRMRRVYHDEAPEPYRRPGKYGVRLGEAVAASSSVPFLFPPLFLNRLYGTVRNKATEYLTGLVDGGAYDNQGIASLREQDCTVVLVSDACGQTEMSKTPPAWRFGVLLRTNDLLMTRVREAQYQLLANLLDAGALQGLFYVHLKKGLATAPVHWRGIDPPAHVEPPPLTDYGIHRDIQGRLAGIRTDIDSFSRMEADALMLSGYKMTGVEWRKCMQDPSHDPPIVPEGDWEFRKLEPGAAAIDKNQFDDLGKGLKAAASLSFKPFRLSSSPDPYYYAVAILLTFLLVLFVALYGLMRLDALRIAGVVAVAVVVALVAWKCILIEKSRRHGPLEIVLALFMCSVGWMLYYPYRWLMNPFYIRWGDGYLKTRFGPGLE